ncbi:hypothetical protein [Trueperella bialowiezensis]|uniref:Uncharacterized protein n=1 Tax=Trueperella bialowiezensis TaxID=312285 RepID=A0A448PD09_9ACTO|nr:hypothetical protein [Trueperella bialowiezensis]VEI12804.1 Uncharacterised protein [Trueperella bialowiezensis]
MISRLLSLLLSAFLTVWWGIGAVQPSHATPTLPPPGEIPAEVNAWFKDKASATVRSYGADAFPEYSVEQVAGFVIGTPTPTVVLGKETGGQVAIDPATRWIAPISDGDTVVGAISVNVTDGIASDEIVRGDARLGSTVARETEARLMWDPELSAWFLLRANTIEPADSAAAKILLGGVPTSDFLLQRQRIISNTDSVKPANEDPVGPKESESRNLPLTLAAVLIATALLIGSLVWLRSENDSDESDAGSTVKSAGRAPGADAGEQHASGQVSEGVTQDRGTKRKFRDSATKVNVYRTKKTKDDSALFDD